MKIDQEWQEEAGYCSPIFIQECIDEGCPTPEIIQVGEDSEGNTVAVVGIDSTIYLLPLG